MVPAPRQGPAQPAQRAARRSGRGAAGEIPESCPPSRRSCCVILRHGRPRRAAPDHELLGADQQSLSECCHPCNCCLATPRQGVLRCPMNQEQASAQEQAKPSPGIVADSAPRPMSPPRLRRPPLPTTGRGASGRVGRPSAALAARLRGLSELCSPHQPEPGRHRQQRSRRDAPAPCVLDHFIAPWTPTPKP